MAYEAIEDGGDEPVSFGPIALTGDQVSQIIEN